MKTSVARTTLIMPLTWECPGGLERLDRNLVQRKYRVGRHRHPLWVETTAHKLAAGVVDLDLVFRQVIGDPERQGWSWRFWKLSPQACQLLFDEPKLIDRRLQKKGTVDKVVVSGMELWLIVMPFGVGMLCLRFHWPSLPLEELAEWLDTARHVRRSKGLRGWQLGPPRVPYAERDLLRESLGETVADAVINWTEISLKGLMKELLRVGDRDCHLRSCENQGRLHTTLVLPEHPGEKETEWLFRASRGYGTKYATPDELVVGHLLAPRSNRRLYSTREGVIALCWTDSSESFDSREWVNRHQGLYLLLALQVLGESLTLSRLSSEAAHGVAKFSRLRRSGGTRSVLEAREELRDLATKMLQCSLALFMEDCGAVTENSIVYQGLLDLHVVRQQRAELRQDVRDLLAVVEADHAEEVAELREREARRDRERADAQRRFATLLALAGAVALPFTMAGGIFGMNFTDTMPQWHFGWVVGLTTLGSSLLAAWAWRSFARSEREEPPRRG
ncbi:MAG: CorA family divalent cation transporter [Acidobacteriota bacterium]